MWSRDEKGGNDADWIQEIVLDIDSPTTKLPWGQLEEETTEEGSEKESIELHVL